MTARDRLERLKHGSKTYFFLLVRFEFVDNMRDMIVWLQDKRPKCGTVPHNPEHVVNFDTSS